MDITELLQTYIDKVSLDLFTQEVKRSAFIFLAILGLERFLLAKQDQPISAMVFNFKWMVVFFFMRMLTAPLLAIVTSMAVRMAGFSGFFKISFEADTILWYISPIIYVCIIDFFYYWMHRSQHTVQLLWRQHKLHHSDEHLNVTTSERHHWLEDVVRIPFVIIPTTILFDISVAQVGLASFFVSYWAFLIHANFRFSMGWLSFLVAGPQLHRIHHSIEPKHFDKNFAAFFPVWDVMFGTYYQPARDEYPDTGIKGEAPITSLRQAFLLPFSGRKRDEGSWQDPAEVKE